MQYTDLLILAVSLLILVGLIVYAFFKLITLTEAHREQVFNRSKNVAFDITIFILVTEALLIFLNSDLAINPVTNLIIIPIVFLLVLCNNLRRPDLHKEDQDYLHRFGKLL